MNYIDYALSQAGKLIGDAYARACESGALPKTEVAQIPVEIPKDTKNGDYTSTFALSMAGALRFAPRRIAETLLSTLDLQESLFARAEIAGPGFINFFLKHDYYRAVIANILEEGEGYGQSIPLKKERVMVEFVSANPTGPMHMGNARGGVVGDCLASILSRLGHEVSREFYINDTGNQVSLFGKSLNARYLQLRDGEDAVVFPEDGYHGDDVRALASAYYEREENRSDDDASREQKLISFALSKNIARMKEELNLYRINYDTWFYESALHESGYVEETMELLKKSGHTYEKDGALWLKTSDFPGCEKDDVLIRANGFYTYFAVDIAYHRDKFEKRGFDRVINIWGADHHGHVARLKAALDALGLDGTSRLEVILMQLVRLTRNGETVRMSKRTGKAISLSDLLLEISVDSARFFFNLRASDTHLEFDLDLAVRQDSQNPVYYVQYVYARIAHILQNLSDQNIAISENADLSLLTAPEELALIRELARFPEELLSAGKSRDPSRLDKYAIDTAAAFHKFYHEHRVIDAAPALRDARICLLLACKTVIANTLSIIGSSAPESM